MGRKVPESGFSVCTDCGENKPIIEFYMEKTRGTISSQCKPCLRAGTKRSYARRRASGELTALDIRDQSLKSRYGISYIDFLAMLEDQDGLCFICGKAHNTLTKGLHVDHNHSTGKVRSLLCPGCNRLVGIYEKDPTLFNRIISYVGYHQ